MSIDSTIITALLAALTSLAAFILFRQYVPKLELQLLVQRIDAGAFVATLLVRNIGHVIVGTRWCSMRVRQWNGSEYAATSSVVDPVIRDGVAYHSGGWAWWRPPRKDTGDVWKLDASETLTIPFVVREIERGNASFLIEAEFCSRARWFPPALSYQWRRLAIHDPMAPTPAADRSVAGPATPPIR